MPESQNIEWKESWRDEYLKWICGFANAKGGKIIIGKNDNGEIVGVAKAKRLIEAWGRGTIKIINECKKAGLPEPIIEYSSGGISVTIFKNKNAKSFELSNDQINKRQLKAIEFLKENRRITNRDYQNLNQISREMATIDLRKLVQLGILVSSGSKGAGAYYVLK